MPFEYLPFVLADRWPNSNGGPLYYKNMPAEERQYLLEVMGIEGKVAQLWAEAEAEAEPGDDIFIAEIEYGLDDDS